MIQRPHTRGRVHLLPNLLVAFAVSACSDSSRPPSRPPAVPAEALWAGGVDGGAWVACRYTTKEPYNGYDCTVFHHPSGQPWAHGIYALVRPTGNGLPPEVPGGPFAGGTLDSVHSYDGESIDLGHGERLVPHIEVSYPTDADHGIRVQYRFGKRLHQERY